MARVSRPKLAVGALLAVMAAAIFFLRGPAPETTAADHRDSPSLLPSPMNGDRDINDIFVFRSPTNANNTVFVYTFQPFIFGQTGLTANPTQQYDIRIDRTGDAIEDITFRVTYGPPDANGVQDVTLRGLPSALFPPTGILARGKTGQNIPIAGGGMFRSGIQDDPFFFDAGSAATGGFADLAQDGIVTGRNPFTGPFNPGVPAPGRNFFGPGANTFAFVIEIPSSRLGPPNSLIGVYGALVRNGALVDRTGRPAISAALIPPLPRDTTIAPVQVERRNAFNQGLPKNDRTDFFMDMVSVLTRPIANRGIYGRTLADAMAISSLLLPDLLIYQIGNPNGFGVFVTSGTGQGGFFAGTVLGNGRRLRDDTIDVELNLLTNGNITSDNLTDDNGTRITDGNMGTVAAFPYIGPPNLPLNSVGPPDSPLRRDINP